MQNIDPSPKSWPKIIEFLLSQQDLYIGRKPYANSLWRSSFGSLGPGRSRGCSRPSTASGIAYTNDLHDGASEVYGSGCISTSFMILIWNTSSSTARLSDRILALPLHSKNGGQASQAVGWSRGGFATKVHVSVDGLGNPLRFILTGGQKRDITQAEGLIADHRCEYVILRRPTWSNPRLWYIFWLGVPGRNNAALEIGHRRYHPRSSAVSVTEY